MSLISFLAQWPKPKFPPENSCSNPFVIHPNFMILEVFSEVDSKFRIRALIHNGGSKQTNELSTGQICPTVRAKAYKPNGCNRQGWYDP